MLTETFDKQVLDFDKASEVEKICKRLRQLLSKKIRRRGLIVALSGGIDSSVTLALSVKAIGPERVLGLLMPESQSADETLELSTMLADHFGIAKNHEDISNVLEAVGFYQRYNEAVQQVIPEYDAQWKSKIVISNAVEKGGINHFSIVAQGGNGEKVRARLPLKAYLEIVAATNFKQRIRKMFEYYHADRLNYAVTGTPNRLEYDQGFFVKLGDGAADVKPIAHLYKSQVYALAAYLGVPDQICKRPPTTDTYSLSQGQDEFYFPLPYDRMDLCLYGKNNAVQAQEVAQAVGLTVEQVERVYADIDAKRHATQYLHMAPVLLGDIPEIMAGKIC